MRSNNTVKRELLERYQGVAFDKTRVMNLFKEKKGSRFKKRNQEAENIINPHVDSDLYHKEHLLEEKFDELKKLSKQLQECRDAIDKNVFQPEKDAKKLERINNKITEIINEAQEDLLSMKSMENKEESFVINETRKNVRICQSLKLKEVTEQIKLLNMHILAKQQKFDQIEEQGWYKKADLDQHMADIIVDRMIMDENDPNVIAHKRNDDINNIVSTLDKVAKQFKEIQLLVINQGTVLDQIDYNLQIAEQNTRKGKDQLISAHKRRTSGSCAKTVIKYQLIAIIFLCIVVYFKYSKAHPVIDNGSSQPDIYEPVAE